MIEYAITTRLTCDECGKVSEAVAESRGRNPRKCEAQVLAKEDGWWVYGRGERAYCPDCKPEEAA